MPERGQSLVEWALLFPLIFMTLVVLFQLFFVAQKKILLTQEAAQKAYAAAIGESSMQKALDSMKQTMSDIQNSSRWGVVGLPSIRPGPLTAWRPYPGIGTYQMPGSLVLVDLNYFVFNHAVFGGTLLSDLRLQAHSELPKEPDIPGAS
jgi:Flp pilus assembly protein TadG